MSSIQIFQDDRFGEVRVTEVNGDPMFCLADVCKALDLKNPSDVKSRLSARGIATTDTLTAGGVQPMTYISEANLYKCVFQSRKAEAEKFQDWVCEEILPTLRKTGTYTMAMPKNYAEALRQLADTVEAKERIQLQLEEKTEQLDEAKDWFSIKRWAKEHGINWRRVSWRALKAISAEHGLEVKKIFDGNYGEVNLYHRKAFAILYGK